MRGTFSIMPVKVMVFYVMNLLLTDAKQAQNFQTVILPEQLVVYFSILLERRCYKWTLYTLVIIYLQLALTIVVRLIQYWVQEYCPYNSADILPVPFSCDRLMQNLRQYNTTCQPHWTSGVDGRGDQAELDSRVPWKQTWCAKYCYVLLPSWNYSPFRSLEQPVYQKRIAVLSTLYAIHSRNYTPQKAQHYIPDLRHMLW